MSLACVLLEMAGAWPHVTLLADADSPPETLVTASAPDSSRRSPPTAAAACCRARWRGPAGRSSGSGCGRRWPRSPPRPACSSPRPGSGFGCALPPLGRAIGLFVFFVLAVAAAVPLFMVRVPSANDGLRRLDRASRSAAPAGHRDRRRDGARGATTRSPSRCGAPTWSARCAPRARSRPGCRCRGLPRAIPMRCARWC